MAWVELVPIGLILALVAWIFLRPFPEQPTDSEQQPRNSSDAGTKPPAAERSDSSSNEHLSR